MGVTTKKKIIPIMIGEIIFPKKIPNLNHNLLNGLNKEDFIKPKIKKQIEIIKAQILISPRLVSGYNAIIKKTIQKTIPKLLLDPIFISSI